MDSELNLLLPLLGDARALTVGAREFHTGRVGGHDIVVCRCGIGKVNAAIGATAMIEAFAPDCVINSGVAGGTGAAGILDLVLASRIAYHDVWCGPGTEWGEAAGCPRFFPGPEGCEELAASLGAKAGLIASGDIFVSREQDVELIL